MKTFEIGERVNVSKRGGWKNCFSGTVVSSEPITTLQGEQRIYMIKFDEPQQDINGSDEYSKAQILGCYLSRAT